MLIAIIGVPPACEAQLARASANDSVARTIAEAEAQGRAYPRTERAPTFPAAVDTLAHIGTAQRVCVDAGTANVVRSGEFYAGPFAGYSENWHTISNWYKLWWQPAHLPDADVPFGLTVRIALLDSVSETYVMRTTSQIMPAAQLAMMNHTPFFGSEIHLPHTGRWLMVASTGANWGCFVYMLK
jgi:hypothetical protein